MTATIAVSQGQETETPLLLCRMLALHLDPDDLRRTEPSMFAEFQSRCRACESQPECAWTLAHDAADPAWQDWRNYCPNSAKLRMLSALRGCQFEAER